jgi:hypothetical protein
MEIRSSKVNLERRPALVALDYQTGVGCGRLVRASCAIYDHHLATKDIKK